MPGKRDGNFRSVETRTSRLVWPTTLAEFSDSLPMIVAHLLHSRRRGCIFGIRNRFPVVRRSPSANERLSDGGRW
jgi:hypothetical protein